MAIYHYHAEWVSRAAGQTTLNSLAYVQKTETRDERLEQTFDYSKQHDELKDVGTLLPEDARQRYKDRKDDAEIWNDLERAEKKDGKIATRLDFALPRELSREQQKQLIRDFGKIFTDEGRVYSFGLHDTGDGNTHADVMISCRAWNSSTHKWGTKYHFVPQLDENGNMILNPKRGRGHDKFLGKKVLNGYDVAEKRQIFERIVNDALEKAGSKERVDCRTLKAQREEQYDLARRAERRGDLDGMLRHDLAAASLDREPTKHEFQKNAGPRADIKEHNEIVRERNAAHVKRVKKRVRDSYWSKRAKRDRQRRGRNAARVESLQASQTDSRLSRRMRLDETHISRTSERLALRPTGPADSHAIVQAQPGRTKPSIDSLFSNSKPARSGEGIEWAIYANKAEAAAALGISTKELDRRCAKQMVEEREQKRGKRFTYRREKLINRIAGHMGKGDGMICAARETGKTANTAVKMSCKMMKGTTKMIEAVRSVVGAIPLVGKPLSGALAIAETPLKVTSKIGQAVTNKADKMLDDDRRDRQPQRSGGQQSRGNGQQQQEQERDERGGGGGLLAGQLGKADDKFDWLDPCMSEMAKAEEEQKQFIRDTLG